MKRFFCWIFHGNSSKVNKDGERHVFLEHADCLNTEQRTVAHAGAFDQAVKVTDRNQNVSRNANGVHHLVSTMWAQSKDNMGNTGFFLNKCEPKVNFIYLFKFILQYLFNTEQ